VRPDVVLLDGKHDYIGRPWTARTLIKADLHSVSVAAASVIAKVCRDRLMDDIGEVYPDFAFRLRRRLPQHPLLRVGPAELQRLRLGVPGQLLRRRLLVGSLGADICAPSGTWSWANHNAYCTWREQFQNSGSEYCISPYTAKPGFH
jgi:hypothetical protein